MALAVELGGVGDVGAAMAQVEAALLRFVDDADEYVRRRALQSLAKVAPQLAEQFALRQWDTAPDYLPWTRMNVLAVLAAVQSIHLSRLWRVAMASPNAYLQEFANTMRSDALEQG
jgi:hypothetical protein